MKVSEKVIEAYKQNSLKKTVIVYFDDMEYTVDPEKVYGESLELKESILQDQSAFEIVGCVSSEFVISIRDFGENVTGQLITAKIYTEGTEDEPIPLFYGYVESVQMQANKQVKKIIAYDILHKWQNIDISDWFNDSFIKGEQYSLSHCRDVFFEHMGIECMVDKPLVNDNEDYIRKKDAKNLSALNFIKFYCQANAVFGAVNREGKFEFRTLSNDIEEEGTYPGLTLYPPFYPGAGRFNPGNKSFIGTYRSLDYEEYKVKPIDKLVIRDSEQSKEYFKGDGDNKYIIQGNIFILGASEQSYNAFLDNLYDEVAGFTYIPYKAQNNGFPFIEVGSDQVSYEEYDFWTQGRSAYKRQDFYIMTRHLKGIQALKDSYSVEGDEYQQEFITNIESRFESINNEVREVSTEIEETVEEIIDEKGLKIVEVQDREHVGSDPNTIYWIAK